jgi:hypothetical protein
MPTRPHRGKKGGQRGFQTCLASKQGGLFRGLLSRNSQGGDPEKLSAALYSPDSSGCLYEENRQSQYDNTIDVKPPAAPRKSSARDCLGEDGHLFIEPSSLCSVMQSSMSEKPEGLFELN